MIKCLFTFLFFIIVLVILSISDTKWPNNKFITISINVTCSLLATLIYLLSTFLIKNFTRLKLLIQTRIINSDKKIRFSISYLYRIKSKNHKFLLVKSSRFGYYQPVGGVYKCFHGHERIFKDLGIEPDDHLNTSGKAKNDLRVLVPAKNALRFIDWFESNKDREISHWREFYEELVETKILDSSIFPNIDYHFIKRIYSPIHYAPKFKGPQCVIYDILEIIPNDKQDEALNKLESEGDKIQYKWVSDNIIDSLGFDTSKRKLLYDIGRHAKIMKELKWIRP